MPEPDLRHDLWQAPEGGPHGVAIATKIYEANSEAIDNFFGRRLHKFSHDLTHEGQTFAIFTFRLEAEAIKFMEAFNGEPFDQRDKGRGSNWMKWYKGRAAGRDRNRSPYDFRGVH